MATMYPVEFMRREGLQPHEQAGEDGEAIVYEVLKEKLPSDWVVFHGVWRFFMKPEDDGYDRYVNREADFVVLVPDKGMVVIEVKNVNYVHIADGLIYYGQDAVGKKLPHKQAHLAAKNFYLEFRAALGIEMEYCSLAIMLKQQRGAVRNLELDDMYLFGNEINACNLRQKIENLFKYGRRFSRQDIDKIVKYWWTAHRFKTDPRICKSFIEQAAAPLSLLLPALEQNEFGIRVNGCAGSGKTWMACKEIARLGAAGEDKRILLLCFNKLLAKWFSEECQDLKSVLKNKTLTVKTIHSLLAEVLRKCGLQHQQDNYEYSEDEIGSICSLVGDDNAYHYDYVFIDEAQDFKSDWWDVIDAMLEANPGMKLYVFCDSNQTLYDKDGDDVEELGVRVDLKKNLRNSLDIGLFSGTFIADETEPLPFKCNSVEVLEPVQNVAERAATVKNLLNDLQKKHALKPSEIMVLTPWGAENQNNSAAQVNGLQRYNGANNKWSWCSVKQFKGLERDFVILTDVPRTFTTEKGGGFSDSDLYVACTRAKYGLYIIPMTVEAKEDLQVALEESIANMNHPKYRLGDLI